MKAAPHTRGEGTDSIIRRREAENDTTPKEDSRPPLYFPLPYLTLPYLTVPYRTCTLPYFYPLLHLIPGISFSPFTLVPRTLPPIQYFSPLCFVSFRDIFQSTATLSNIIHCCFVSFHTKKGWDGRSSTTQGKEEDSCRTRDFHLVA